MRQPIISVQYYSRYIKRTRKFCSAVGYCARCVR